MISDEQMLEALLVADAEAACMNKMEDDLNEMSEKIEAQEIKLQQIRFYIDTYMDGVADRGHRNNLSRILSSTHYVKEMIDGKRTQKS